MGFIKSSVRHLIRKLSTIPHLKGFINRSWNTYEHIIFTFSIWKNTRRHNTKSKIDALAIFWINPTEIKIQSSSSFDLLRDTGLIADGSWDAEYSEPTNSFPYEFFKKRFHEECAWDVIDSYKNRIEKIKSGRERRYATIDEFETKLRTYDSIYDQFLQNGYLLQSELSEKRAANPGDGGHAFFPSITDYTLLRHEIAVNVGRDGTLLRNDGQHRHALALLAGLEEIPVRIVVRHTEWQDLRDKVAQTIDDALDSGVPTEQIQDYVTQTLDDELKSVPLGIEHPDLAIIFEHRVPDHDPIRD